MSAINSSVFQRRDVECTPESKLNKLRLQLAHDGCTHSQLSLAKALLESAKDSEKGRKDNSEIAVKWLLMASSEGNTEAFRLLENCYKMGVGVNDKNCEEVERCLKSTNEEKLAQRVGCNLFRLVAYDTQDTIPLEYFRQRIALYLTAEDVTENLNFESEDNSSGAHISVKDVVSSVHSCLVGRYPSVSLDSLSHPVPEKDTNNFKLNVKYVKRILNIYLSVLDMLCLKLADLHLLLHAVVFLLVAVFLPSVYMAQSEKDVFFLLKTGAAYYSFLIITVTSARIVRNNKNIVSKDRWKEIVRRSDSKLADGIPDHSYFECIPNFILFLFGVLLFVTTDELECTNLKAFGKWLLLSFSLRKVDTGRTNVFVNIFLVSSFLLALSKLTDGLGAFAWLSNDLFSVNLPVTNQLLTVRPVDALSCFTVIVYTILFCTCRLQWGLSFLATFIWFHIVFVDLNNIRMFLLNFILLSLILPFTRKFDWYGKVMVILLILQLTVQSNFVISFFEMVKLLLTFILTDAIISLKKKCHISSFKLYSVMFLFIMSLSQTFLVPYFSKILDAEVYGNITWSDYSNLCHRHAWSETNMAHAQLNCNKYKGWTIMVEGNVEKVMFKNSISLHLPGVQNLKLAEAFKSNRYEITLHIKGTFRIEAEISVVADDVCKNFVFDLRSGDLLSIIGTFEDGLGTDKPILKLLSAECISCMEDIMCDAKRTDHFDYKLHSLEKIGRLFIFPWRK